MEANDGESRCGDAEVWRIVSAMIMPAVTRSLLHRLPVRALVGLVVCALLAGCGRDNGSPRDLTEHLKASGIVFTPTRVYAPLTARWGFLIGQYDAPLAAKIIDAFKLKAVPEGDNGRLVASQIVGQAVVIKEMWGAFARPPQFKLKNGGQFEFFYLIVTPDGEMYLLVEYAYG